MTYMMMLTRLLTTELTNSESDKKDETRTVIDGSEKWANMANGDWGCVGFSHMIDRSLSTANGNHSSAVNRYSIMEGVDTGRMSNEDGNGGPCQVPIEGTCM